MGSSSTHHIVVTKKNRAYIKANRKYWRMKKMVHYVGKYGSIGKESRLADRFRKSSNFLNKKKVEMSLSGKIDIAVMCLAFLLVCIVIKVFAGF